jgi:hypothetical protein
MTLIASNTFNTTLAASASVCGPYVDTSVNTAVRIWANADQAMNIYIIYADTSSGDSSLSELYHVYKSHTTAINSTVKKAFSKTLVTNPSSSITVPNVSVKTKHSTRDPHPVLTYMTDDIVAQANFNLDEFDISFDHSTSSLQIYGLDVTDSYTHRALVSDALGHLLIGGSVSANMLVDNDEISLINPLVIGGEAQDGAVATIATDLSGRLTTVTFIGDASVSSTNPMKVQLIQDNIGVGAANPLDVDVYNAPKISIDISGHDGSYIVPYVSRMYNLHLTNISGAMMFCGISATTASGTELGILMRQGVPALNTRDITWHDGYQIDGSITIVGAGTSNMTGSTGNSLMVTMFYSTTL